MAPSLVALARYVRRRRPYDLPGTIPESISQSGQNPENAPLFTGVLPEISADALASSADGLIQTEALTRLDQYGLNALDEIKTNVFLKFLIYFWAHPPG